VGRNNQSSSALRGSQFFRFGVLTIRNQLHSGLWPCAAAQIDELLGGKTPFALLILVSATATVGSCEEKDPAAAALGRRGGAARAAALGKRQLESDIQDQLRRSQ
jgi:hypothetical protein